MQKLTTSSPSTSSSVKSSTADRDTLVKVAKGYHDLIALQAEQRKTMALMLRTCVARLKSPDSRKRKEAIDGLADLANMLDKQEKSNDT